MTMTSRNDRDSTATAGATTLQSVGGLKTNSQAFDRKVRQATEDPQFSRRRSPEEVAIPSATRFPSRRIGGGTWPLWLQLLVATATDLLEESVQMLAMKILRENSGGPDESEKS